MDRANAMDANRIGAIEHLRSPCVPLAVAAGPRICPLPVPSPRGSLRRRSGQRQAFPARERLASDFDAGAGVELVGAPLKALPQCKPWEWYRRRRQRRQPHARPLETTAPLGGRCSADWWRWAESLESRRPKHSAVGTTCLVASFALAPPPRTDTLRRDQSPCFDVSPK